MTLRRQHYVRMVKRLCSPGLFVKPLPHFLAGFEIRYALGRNINRGAGAGIKVGQKFNVHHVVDEIKDADGKLLDKVIEQTGVLEVTQVLANSAICKLVSGKAAVNDTVK